MVQTEPLEWLVLQEVLQSLPALLFTQKFHGFKQSFHSELFTFDP